MNSVYESLRTLLRNKELEIKKLEKEIEALRIVLPIVAEAGDAPIDAGPSFEPPRPINDAKSKPVAGADIENMLSQVKAAPSGAAAPSPQRPTPVPDVAPKARTSWP